MTNPTDEEMQTLEQIAALSQDAAAALFEGRPCGVVMIVARQADDGERTDVTMVSCLCRHMTARILIDMTRDYLADHPELTEESIADHIRAHDEMHA